MAATADDTGIEPPDDAAAIARIQEILDDREAAAALRRQQIFDATEDINILSLPPDVQAAVGEALRADENTRQRGNPRADWILGPPRPTNPGRPRREPPRR